MNNSVAAHYIGTSSRFIKTFAVRTTTREYLGEVKMYPARPAESARILFLPSRSCVLTINRLYEIRELLIRLELEAQL